MGFHIDNDDNNRHLGTRKIKRIFSMKTKNCVYVTLVKDNNSYMNNEIENNEI